MAARPGYISLPIIIVLLAIAYLYHATVFVVIEGWLGLRTAAGLANASVFSAVAAVAVVTYGIAVSRDPGASPVRSCRTLRIQRIPYMRPRERSFSLVLLLMMYTGINSRMEALQGLHISFVGFCLFPYIGVKCSFGLAYLPHLAL